MNRGRVLIIGILLLASFGWFGCSSHRDVWKDLGGPPRVVVTIAPLASWVKAIGGDHVGVICLCTTTGPHQYDYKARENISVREADLLLAIGLELDNSFADRLHRSASNKKLRYVKLGDKLPANLKLKAEHDSNDAHEGHDHHGEWDPHIWLGLDTARELTTRIRDQLVDLDPKNKADYDRNYESLQKSLTNLGTEANQLLGGKQMRLVTFHDSMRYFARSVPGLEIVDTVENGPGNDPNAHRFIKLVEECKEKSYRFIAKEPQYPSQAVDTLKSALKKEKQEVEIFDLDPLETANPQELDADWYLRGMKRNLQNIRDALRPSGGEKATQ